MKTNKTIKVNKNLTLKLLTIIIIVITILSINITNVSASTQTNTIDTTNTMQSNISDTTIADNKPSGYYGYYGIVQGDGHTTKIYIKINGNWERYIIKSDYIGYECKIVSFDQKITLDNYKTVRVINIIDTTDKVKTDNTIHDYMLFKVFKEPTKGGKN